MKRSKSPGPRSAAASALWLVFVALYLAPIWAFKYVPSEDGPSHLGNAAVIRYYVEPEGAAFREYYALRKGVLPNVLYHYGLASLLTFLPPLLAEKVLLSLIVVGFAWALRHAAAAAGTRPGPALLLALPIIYSFPVQMGFYGFFASLPFALWAWGYYWRRRDRLTWPDVLFLNVAGGVAFFAHLLGWALLIGGLLYLVFAHFTWFGVRERRWTPRRLLTPLYVLPAAAMGIVYYFSQKRLDKPARRSWEYLREQLFGGEAFIALDAVQKKIAPYLPILLAVLIGAVLITKIAASRRNARNAAKAPAWREWDAAWGLAIPAAVALYLLVPDATPFRGNYISCRLALVPFLAAAIWLAGVEVPWVRRLTYIIGPAVAAAFLWGTWKGFTSADFILKEFNAGHWAVTPRSTVAVVTNKYAPDLEALVNFTKHAGGYYMASEYVAQLTNYEPNYAYFPVKWEGRRQPLRFAGYKEGTPSFKWEAIYPEIDYILAWDVDLREERLARVLPRYELAHNAGRLSVWRRRDYHPPPSP